MGGTSLLHSNLNLNKLSNEINKFDLNFGLPLNSTNTQQNKTNLIKFNSNSFLNKSLNILNKNSLWCMEPCFLNNSDNYKINNNNNNMNYSTPNSLNFSVSLSQNSINNYLKKQLNLNSTHDFGNYESKQKIKCSNLCQSSCCLNLCSQWNQSSFTDNSNTYYHGDVQIIYKAKLDLLKQFNTNSMRSRSNLNKNHHHHHGSEQKQSYIRNYSSKSLNKDDCLISDDNAMKYNLNTNSCTSSSLSSSLLTSTKNKQSNSNVFNLEKNQSMQQIKKHSEYVLIKGVHIFDFEFQLPADLPCSFELPSNCLAGGALGSIKYAVRIEILSRKSQIRHCQQRKIIIFRPLELIHYPRLRVSFK